MYFINMYTYSIYARITDNVNSKNLFNPSTCLTEAGLQEVGVALDIGLFTAVKVAIHFLIRQFVLHNMPLYIATTWTAWTLLQFTSERPDRIMLLSKHLPCGQYTLRVLSAFPSGLDWSTLLSHATFYCSTFQTLHWNNGNLLWYTAQWLNKERPTWWYLLFYLII